MNKKGKRSINRLKFFRVLHMGHCDHVHTYNVNKYLVRSVYSHHEHFYIREIDVQTNEIKYYKKAIWEYV